MVLMPVSASITGPPPVKIACRLIFGPEASFSQIDGGASARVTRWRATLSRLGIQQHIAQSCSTLPTQLCSFDICRRAGTNHTRLLFPGSDGLDYDLDARQCAFDLTLHALNLGLEECLQLLELGR